MNNRNIDPMSPFITFCQKIIPLAYDESMSYYESLCALRDYVGQMIEAVNNNADAVTELQNKYIEFTTNMTNLFNELKNYVDNYFKNLDVQDEINNKLDEMAKSGELTDLIAQYLQLASVLAFNTRTDLKNANNLNNGSFAYCFGKEAYNDGYGAFYKIRESINTDVADGENLIALTNYPDLIAEKMPDKYLSDSITTITNNLNNLTETVENNYTEITNNLNNLTETVENNYTELDNKIENFEKQKITLVLGDSYTANDEEGIRVRDNAQSWCIEYQTITKNKVINKAKSGAGFKDYGYSSFNSQYMEAINDNEIDNSLIDTIIIYGGLNDLDQGNINDTISSAKTLGNSIKSNTPLAKVYCAFFNAPKRKIKSSEINATSKFIYELASYNWNFNRSAGWLKGKSGECYADDNYHPNAKGCHRIVQCVNAFLNGGEGISLPVTIKKFVLTSDPSGEMSFQGKYINNIRYFPLTGTVQGEAGYTFSSPPATNPSVGRYISWRAESDLDAITENYYPCNTAYGEQGTSNHDIFNQSNCQAYNNNQNMCILVNSTVFTNNTVNWSVIVWSMNFSIT